MPWNINNASFLTPKRTSETPFFPFDPSLTAYLSIIEKLLYYFSRCRCNRFGYLLLSWMLYTNIWASAFPFLNSTIVNHVDQSDAAMRMRYVIIKKLFPSITAGAKTEVKTIGILAPGKGITLRLADISNRQWNGHVYRAKSSLARVIILLSSVHLCIIYSGEYREIL